MEWTPELAIETDRRVRSELRTSRASLIQFIAEGAWRLLPTEYPNAAAYVQDAAGVKRSEAYRLVATARAAEMILGRLADSTSGEDPTQDIRAYRWIVNDVIRSSHTGEALASNISEVIGQIESRQASGIDVWEAITTTVDEFRRAHRSESVEQDPPPLPPDSVDDFAFDDPDEVKPERQKKVVVCPNCGEEFS